MLEANFYEVPMERDVCPILEGYRMMYADELTDPYLFKHI